MLGCMAITMLFNFLFGWGLGQTQFDRAAMAASAVVIDLAKVVAVWFAFEWCHARAWSKAVPALIASFLLVLVGLTAAVGFISQTRSGVVGDHEMIVANYKDAERELGEVERRRQVIATERTSEQVNADIAGRLRAPVMEGTRVRGGVDGVSKDCTRTDPLTIEACKKIVELRQELADAVEAARLEQSMAAIRVRLAALRAQGGMQESNVQAGTLHKMLGTWLSLASIKIGLEFLVPVAAEFWAIVGLWVVTERSREPRRRSEDAAEVVEPMQLTTPAVVPEARGQPATRIQHEMTPQAPPSAATEPKLIAVDGTTIGAPEVFFKTCLQPDHGCMVRRAVLFECYRTWCAKSKFEPLEGRVFAKRFKEACDAAGVEWVKDGAEVCIARMQLVA